jgi:hypothetical protein
MGRDQSKRDPEAICSWYSIVGAELENGDFGEKINIHLDNKMA